MTKSIKIEFIVQAIKEAQTYLTDGYFIITSFGGKGKWFCSMRHRSNGNRISFLANEKGYIVKKNGKEIKSVS